MDRIYPAQVANQMHIVQKSFENDKIMGGPLLDGGKKSLQ